MGLSRPYKEQDMVYLGTCRPYKGYNRNGAIFPIPQWRCKGFHMFFTIHGFWDRLAVARYEAKGYLGRQVCILLE